MAAEIADETIMLRVKEGNLSELAELFDRYHVKMYNFFMKLTFDKVTSEDLTQTVFYRIIKYRHTYHGGDGSFKPWIFRMGRNVYYDHCREQKKVAGSFRNMEEYHENVPDDSTAYTEEHFHRLDRALLQMVPDQREVIVMSRFQGLKYREIADIKEISIPAIKVQIHRAMKQLRNLYFKQS